MQDVKDLHLHSGIRKGNHIFLINQLYHEQQQQNHNNHHPIRQSSIESDDEQEDQFQSHQSNHTRHHYQPYREGDVEVKGESHLQHEDDSLSSSAYSQDLNLNSSQAYFHQNLHLCTMCEKGFPSPARLNRHLKTHLTDDEKPYRCEMCEKGFSAKWNLDRHVKEAHQGVKRDRPSRKDDPDRPKRPEEFHKCPICEKVFSHRTSLTRHIRSHSDDKPYECDTCDKSFVQASDLDRHRRVHTGEKPFQCNQCDRAFTQSANLSRHLKYHETLKAKKIVYGRDMNLLKDVVDYKKLHEMGKDNDLEEGAASSTAGSKKRQKTSKVEVDIDDDEDEDDIMSD